MDDHGNSPETATLIRLSEQLNDPVRRRGEIKPKADEDWFKISLQKGEWYWFDLSDVHFIGPPNFEIFRGEEQLRTLNGFGTYFLRATQTAEYQFRIFHGQSSGGRYAFAAASFDGPNVLARVLSHRAGQQSSFWSNGGLFGTSSAQSIQFFYNAGQTPFSILNSSSVFESDTIHEIQKPIANSLHSALGEVTQQSQTVEFYGRLNRGGEFQKWTRTSIAPLPNFAPALGDQWLKGSSISYSFDDVLPAYYDSEAYADFRPLIDDQKSAMRAALRAWGEFINIHFREVPSGLGFIRMGARNLDEPYQAFKRTTPWHRYRPDTIESDIFISNKVPYMQNLRQGSEGFYRLLQSVGVAIGLNHPITVEGLLSSEFNNSMYTVMSNFNHPKFGDVYPSKPALFDILQIQKNYRASFPKENATYTFSASGQWRGAIAASAGQDIVSAAGHHNSAVIRLEAGEFSYIGSPNRHFWVNAQNTRDEPRFSTFLETAIGGKRADRLVGSKERNQLFGGPGRDTLVGRQANDFLNGGKGNDRYLWSLGDGSDVISERTGNGRDLLQIQSQWGLDNFSDDLTFQRIGNDLMINLDFEKGQAHQGTIRIENMARRQSQIETLRVLSRDQRVLADQVSLISVWTQLKNQTGKVPSSFVLSNQKDRFGIIVVPES